jgi:hypothetical protein
MTTAKPLARYGAIGGALRERLCSSYTTAWDTTGDLRDFERMGQPRPVRIAIAEI